ncbi:MAG TPA: GH116 family glycosyl hydrolase [Vicinamibacteria bacterium]
MNKTGAASTILIVALAAAANAVPRFDLPKSGLELARHTESGKFFDVVGRRSAVFGYENRPLEAWVYPLKLIDDFRLSFQLQGYPLEIDAAQIVTGIAVRPEATTFTYSHAGFTVRQTIFAPLDEPGVVMLLDVDSVLPLTVIGSFRPRLKLMWPAGLMTSNVGWDEKDHVYSLTEESKRFAAVIGTPGARDVSLMPYQEEPRDVPVRFVVEVAPDTMRSHFIPIVIAGSVEGRDKAKATYDRLLASARSLYESNVAYYRGLEERTLTVETPDERLDTALRWAKVGVDKGIATNPLLGTGLVAGFRTSGESERPGFAWMFGRDALWSSLAIHSYGDFPAARTALEFLRKLQRDDGKIPHEISQSATLVPWFKDYEYPWASADATPLYVVLQADHFRHTGDRDLLRASWDSIVKAWGFSAATDTDGNGLIENDKFGHGWTEGSPPYPPHEEIYMQGIWIEAGRGLAEMAEAMGDVALAEKARAASARTQAAVEKTYWLGDRGFYAFATALAKPEKDYKAEAGPRRAERQARIDALRGHTIVDEDTILPAVPLWWRTLDPARADAEIDRLGSADLAADWGQRLLSEKSELYDPLSYHYGSVWPLFTGWASVGAYQYGRPHVGYQALMTNALLTFPWALGYVTELLSGEFHAPFGRSSHHQVWSEAMVVSPLVRGLLGIEVSDAGRRLRFAPQMPADWDRLTVRRIAAAASRVDLALERAAGRLTITETIAAGPPPALSLAPAFPLDARLRSVTVDGSAARFRAKAEGDVQRVEVDVPAGGATPRRIVFAYDEGTDVFTHIALPDAGSTSEGLRILRSRVEGGALRLVVEGRSGRSYHVGVRTPRRLASAPGVTVTASARGADLLVSFEGVAGGYARRSIVLPLR